MPRLDQQGRAWAEMLANRFDVRAIYLDSMVALNESFVAFDAAAGNQGMEAARKAAAERVQRAVDLSKEAIETYARVIRNTGDKGVVAQMNEQYYKVLKDCLKSLGGGASP
jgi:hypothetical protein